MVSEIKVMSQVARTNTMEDFEYECRDHELDSVFNIEPVQRAEHQSDELVAPHIA